MKRWITELWEKLRGRRAAPRRTYSMAGWVRAEDGIYRNGTEEIFRRGRTWVRVKGGFPDEYTEECYPTLHAAIKQERIEPEAPLLDQGGQEDQIG